MYPDPDPTDTTVDYSPDEQTAASDAEFAFAQGNLGNLYRTQGRYDEAVAAYRRALSVPDSAGTPASICGHVDEALALLEVAIAERPALRSQAQNNTHFDFIRDDPRFQALVGA